MSSTSSFSCFTPSAAAVFEPSLSEPLSTRELLTVIPIVRRVVGSHVLLDELFGGENELSSSFDLQHANERRENRVISSSPCREREV